MRQALVVILAAVGVGVGSAFHASAQLVRPSSPKPIAPTTTVNQFRSGNVRSDSLQGTEAKVLEPTRPTTASNVAPPPIVNPFLGEQEEIRLPLENGAQLVRSPQGRGQQLGTFPNDDTVLGRKVEVQIPVSGGTERRR
ncbi:MAG: hypothetical protein SFW36_06625 [Leptolyngbyaceae cyanobacterium bins.59]|nr:hypothetical protein [Leptolyngbyaceae cyanobacterium bins.59]